MDGAAPHIALPAENISKEANMTGSQSKTCTIVVNRLGMVHNRRMLTLANPLLVGRKAVAASACVEPTYTNWDPYYSPTIQYPPRSNDVV
jgi:hypothetical protein